MELTKQSVLFLLNQNKKTTGLDADTLDGKDSAVFLDKSETATLTGDLTLTGTVVSMTALPTADPLVAGQLWNNAGVLTVSAG